MHKGLLKMQRLIEFKPDGKPYWREQPMNRRKLDLTKPAGSLRSDGYRVIKSLGLQVLAHRLFWFINYGCLPSLIDHRNQDKDYNTLKNLRVATDSQNKQNMAIRKNNTSGVKGVSPFRRGWRARIVIDYKEISKTFKTLEAAVEWRKAKEVELHPFRPTA
jgi:hypothetical protein